MLEMLKRFIKEATEFIESSGHRPGCSSKEDDVVCECGHLETRDALIATVKESQAMIDTYTT